MHRVVITGAGVVSPYGSGLKAFWEGLVAARSPLAYDKQLGFVVGKVSEEAGFERWSKGERREMSRASQMALLAAEQAMEGKGDLDHTDTLVNIGTGVTDLDLIGETHQLIEKGQTRRVSPYFVPRILNNLPAGYVAMKYGMMGGAEACSTACATGVHTIGSAYRSVSAGFSRRAIAGAAEGCVNRIGLSGFDRMRALARGDGEGLSRPFDKNRSGFVLSEGVGLVVLERLEDAKQRGADILAEVVGYGVSSDCYHITSPNPNAIGARLCMQRAMHTAGVSAHQVGYVNAHATSTPTGDGIEAKAIRELFGDKPLVSSIKGHIGHLLAAAGAVETIATIQAVKEGVVPGNLNLEESDVGEGIRLMRDTEDWKGKGRRVAVVNSFGFGGTNASLVIASV